MIEDLFMEVCGMLYEIKREERENHRGHFKACLYLDGNKIAVCKDGKVTLKTARSIPQRYIDELTAEWQQIAANETLIQ